VAELTTTPALAGAGIAESDWRSCQELQNLRPWRRPTPSTGRCVVVAPHPDDEVLGVGGTSLLLFAAGIDIALVAVTDGENSHDGRRAELRQRRPLESAAAAACLGLSPAATFRLGHPDGAVAEPRLRAQLDRIVQSGDLVLAPWDHDGHPDHNAVGRAARAVASRHQAPLLFYLVWAWHWASPDNRGLPWEQAVQVPLARRVAERKRRAVRCFTTQLAGPDPILPTTMLDRLTRPFEVLLGP
jgi:LmbE family N-acetylglucosaminyl deacetylase